ncbi:hypothetical protein HY409_01270 [Candidatus Gottesmanbacteria bacterium]|nr:hypothetical protein [Candidatus Gottesmanbacteria bacterium]
MKRHSYFFLFVLFSASFFVFRKWFTLPEIIGGDWPYYYEANLKNFFLVPTIWQPWLGNGLGNIQPLLGLHLFGSMVIVFFTQWLHIPWNIAYKVGWFGLFFILSFFSPIVLWYRVFPRVSLRWPYLLSGLFYSTNTYILMVTGGGQMGVAIAYGLAPLVLSSFIKMTRLSSDAVVNVKYQMSNVKCLLIAGLLFGMQLMIDPRIAYVTMVGVGLYAMVSWFHGFMVKRNRFLRIFFSSVIALCSAVILAGFLNAFWVLPMVVMRNNPLESLGSTYTSIESLKFFSFADFSHALTLLHPNWPENIFGKTYFLQPEFLIIPILAFASLLYIKSLKHEHQRIVLFFTLLSLLGIFLSKGSNAPFGQLYLWMFSHVPGFVMFRDPTKFYVLTAVGFSMLIPFVVSRFEKYNIPFTLVVVIFWFTTIRQAVTGQLGGTFAYHTTPVEYKQVQVFLESQKGFSRTFWVPRQSRFTYASLDHLATEAEPLFSATNPGQLKEILTLPSSQKLLSDIGVGYVMIPYDSLGELFLKDRIYDNTLRKEYEAVLDGTAWLTKINAADIPIYRAPKHKDLFSLSTGGVVTYRRISLVQYEVSFMISAPSQLYFSEAYHPGWVLVANGRRVTAHKSDTGLSLFSVPNPDTYYGKIIFEPQKYVHWGLVVSAVTLLGIICKIVLL